MPRQQKVLSQLRSSLDSDRIQALLDLIKLPGPPPLDELFRLAHEDPNPGVRYYARRAFAALKGRPAAATGPEPAADPRDADLEKALGSLDPTHLREALRRALAEPRPAHLPLLVKALQQESVPEMRASLVLAVGRLGTDAEVDLLTTFLGDRDQRVRGNAVEALASLGNERAIVHLIPLLQDPDHRVKANAAKALAGVEGHSVPGLLRQMALEGEAWDRDAALHALDSLDAPFAHRLMGEMAERDPLPRLRLKARGHLEAHAARGSLLARQIVARLRPDARNPA